jgi:hypothetical protein
MAMLLAGVLSIATISTKTDKNEISKMSVPGDLADEAARAGLDAAKWHIECHGRTTAGSLSPHFYINGATYSIAWSDLNLTDSTVHVRSLGQYAIGRNQEFRVSLASKIKIDFLPAHRNKILTDYYSEDRSNLLDSIPK